ncbi:MAG: FAD-dependent 5-carboxymethylaminomethyl-2-thiouridine(34) oxidoreductase MnmC, partial [Bdellovibrionales bacterium]|nr:FAD-dependent 5-carboxymethylaminomethyl-2-thiouridine(34) oxidoreductase MnmC [Bdellovibrionales bacterium]
LFYPFAASLNPRALVTSLLENSRIRVRYLTEAFSLARSGSHWQARSADGSVLAHADLCVVATGSGQLSASLSSAELFHPVRGQLATLSETATSRNLQRILCFDNYVIPSRNGKHVVGATFDRASHDREASRLESERLKQSVARVVPSLAAALGPIVSERVSFRACTTDRLPAIGPLPMPDAAERFPGIWFRTADSRCYPREFFQPNLYTSVGHGSHGLLTALLGGELIAALAFDLPLPLAERHASALAPARFLVRALRRRDPSLTDRAGTGS